MQTITEIKTGQTATPERVVVFVPEGLEDINDFARQVYLLALAEQREVLYLAVNRGELDPLAAARLLATLTALTQDRQVSVRSRQVGAADWVDALRQVTRPGDLVAWAEAGLAAPAGLEAELGIIQHVLPGAMAAARRNWLRPALFWLLTVALLAGFSYLEVSLWNGPLGDFWKKAALIALFGAEMGGVYAWNRWFTLREHAL